MNKKILQIALIALGISSLSAQNFTFEDTDFKGALSADASKDWTKTGWTNFNPNAAIYPAVTNTTTLAAGNGVIDITNIVTLDASQTYLLSGVVAIKSGGKLIVPAGTVIRGKSDFNASATVAVTNFALIVVEKGGQIFVNGTADKPVVMTSNANAGRRNPGDWAGLVICGNATTNQAGTPALEGFNRVTTYLDSKGGTFGGTNDADNSGVLKYLRVEFAGLPLDVNREINGITFGGVGSGTEVDYVQVSYSNDDSFEWFGGTVNSKHLIAYHGVDDDFDTDFGYRGNNQFGLGIKNPKYYDLTFPSSTSEGFESDNDATGTTNTPITAAKFYNYTMVGPISEDSTYATTKSVTTKDAFRRGARLRRNSRQSIVNSIFMGYRNFLMIDGPSSLTNYGVSSNPQVVNTTDAMFKGNIFHNSLSCVAATSNSATQGLEVTSINVTPATTPPTVDVPRTVASRDALVSWVKDSRNLNLFDVAAWGRGSLLIDPQNLTNPDFRPINATITGLKNETVYDASLGVYPNPVSENATLFISENEESYSLMNTQGTLVKTGVDTKINMNGVDKGLYILKVGKKSTKVVVE